MFKVNGAFVAGCAVTLGAGILVGQSMSVDQPKVVSGCFIGNDETAFYRFWDDGVVDRVYFEQRWRDGENCPTIGRTCTTVITPHDE